METVPVPPPPRGGRQACEHAGMQAQAHASTEGKQAVELQAAPVPPPPLLLQGDWPERM
jgi:hypothetical protein